MSLALKEFGFGSLIYGRDETKEDEFRRIMAYYVESGIPVIVTIKADQGGHAIVIAGHILSSQLEGSHEALKYKGIKIIDSADSIQLFVALDDNLPPYRRIAFNDPCGNYEPGSFKGAKIQHIVVPLYRRIYLDAITARRLCLKNLEQRLKKIKIEEGTELVLRLFLTSARSFKRNCLITNYPQELRDWILQLRMPKFIWVGELSRPEFFREQQATGLIILDATDGNRLPHGDPLLFFLDGHLFVPGQDGGEEILNTGADKFSLYRNNLKGEWSSWKDP